MQRRELLLGGAATVALAGCLGSARESDDETQTTDQRRTIRVQASGEVEAEPDLAVLEVGVESTGGSAESVRSDLAERSEAVRDALLEFGLDEDDVTTGRFDVRRRTDDPRGPPEEPVDPEEGDVTYEGVHTLTVEVDDVDETGAVIDTAVDAGADGVGSVRFTLSEEARAELRKRALEVAIESARSEAEFVAGEVDASIVEARTVDTSGGGVEPVRASVEADAAAETAESTELHPDDVTVSASVVVEYEME